MKSTPLKKVARHTTCGGRASVFIMGLNVQQAVSPLLVRCILERKICRLAACSTSVKAHHYILFAVSRSLLLMYALEGPTNFSLSLTWIEAQYLFVNSSFRTATTNK